MDPYEPLAKPLFPGIKTESDGVRIRIGARTPFYFARGSYVRQVLEQAFPGEDERYFTPTIVGSTPTSADEGATAILDGSKTTTSSPFWDWPDGRIPFVGALSVLLDGKGSTRAIVETLRVEIKRFGDVDESFAWSYGEGQRTLEWWRSEIGAWYRESAARHRTSFSDETPIICEWITVVKRL